MKHTMKLWDDSFSSINMGYKTVEMRLNDEKRRLIKKNDYIEFINTKTKEVMDVLVLDCVVYKDFFELYRNYDKISIGYKEDETANPIDMLVYYNQEDIDKYGVLAIHIKKL